MDNSFITEPIQKAKQAKSSEELLALARENGQELTEEEAQFYFEKLNKRGELSDNKLENVAGGGCNSQQMPSNYVYTYHSCYLWVCNRCGKTISEQRKTPTECGYSKLDFFCFQCKYSRFDDTFGCFCCENPSKKF